MWFIRRPTVVSKSINLLSKVANYVCNSVSSRLKGKKAFELPSVGVYFLNYV